MVGLLRQSQASVVPRKYSSDESMNGQLSQSYRRAFAGSARARRKRNVWVFMVEKLARLVYTMVREPQTIGEEVSGKNERSAQNNLI